jgi:endoglucanase
MTKPSKQSTFDLIKNLSIATGVSGYRGPNEVHAAVTAALTPYVDRVDRDRLGSVIGLKLGQQATAQRRKIMLAAHLDEIGAIVSKIEQGLLRFSQVGSLDNRLLMGQEVVVHGRRDLPGIIGSIPPHLLTPGQSQQKVDPTLLHIDLGLPPRQVSKFVEIGDVISFVGPATALQNGLMSGKAMDNRASIAAMVVCLQTLNGMRHDWDVYAVATADEEWGRYVGATTQSYAIQPDVAIVIDVTFADVEGVDLSLGKGPVISLGPSNHPVMRRRLLEICQNLELKYQNEVVTGGAGTDAYAVEISREGVPTILISVPSRYMHSPTEVVDPKDVERIGRLMAHFIASLDEQFVTELIPTIE